MKILFEEIDKIKTCVSCGYCNNPTTSVYNCTRVIEIDLITASTCSVPCVQEREAATIPGSKCGPEGRYWKPKSIETGN